MCGAPPPAAAGMRCVCVRRRGHHGQLHRVPPSMRSILRGVRFALPRCMLSYVQLSIAWTSPCLLLTHRAPVGDPVALSARVPFRALQALAQATGRKETAVKAEYGTSGDLGAVAAAARGMQRTMCPLPRLTIREVQRHVGGWGGALGGCRVLRPVAAVASVSVVGLVPAVPLPCCPVLAHR